MSVDKKDFSHSFTVLSGIKLDTAQFIIFFNSKEYRELNVVGTFHPTFLQFFSKLFYLCHFYSDMHKKCWPRNPLTSSRLSCLGRKRPRRQFFSRYVKERFRGPDIRITIKNLQIEKKNTVVSIWL
jgi:hypothetical protein